MIRCALLHGPLRQRLETPAGEAEPGAERGVAALRASGPFGQ
jgi:hypothetical protein